tara:strand:+ start:505 stop:972 length:468 start_codon:yes stop_codon:yes gene_type:complete
MIRKTNITNEEYEGMNGTITGEFETEQERIEFENLNGLQSGKFFQVSNKNMRLIKKECRRGRLSDLLDNSNNLMYVKKYGKDDYRIVDTGERVLSAKMIDKNVQKLKEHAKVKEVFADNMVGQISQSLSDKGYNRNQISEVLDTYLQTKHYKEVA